MKKEILETFIKRYNLGDIIPKAKWKYSFLNKTLHTRASADSRSFVVDVIRSNMPDFNTEDVVLCIADTGKVKSMLAPFDDDVNISINKRGDRILGMHFSNADVECYCTAADPSAMDPQAKNLDDTINYCVVVPLTDDFLEKFLKGHSALKDVPTFKVATNSKGIFEIVIGYATENSNRIRLTPPTDSIKNKMDSGAIEFPIKNIIEVLKANSDISGGTLSISGAGVIQLYFKNDDYTCTYYQFANKKV